MIEREDGSPREEIGAVRVTFNLCEMFPSDEALSVPLLRLLAATNDARFLQTLVATVSANLDSGTEFDRLIRQGQLLYLLRMLGTHLYEAGLAFRDCQDKCLERIQVLLPDGFQGRQAFEALSGVFNDPAGKEGFEKAVLQPIRTLWTVHYKAERFREALEGTRDDEVEMVACQQHVLGRYAFVDNLTSQYSLEKLCHPFGGLDSVVDRLMELTGNLATVTDTMLEALFEEKRGTGATIDASLGLVTVPTWLRQARARLGENQQLHPTKGPT